MTKEDLINYVYKNKLVFKFGHKFLSGYTAEQREDLISEVYLNICLLPEETLLDLWKQGEDHFTAFFKVFIERQLNNTGQTRKLQKMFKKEIATDYDVLFAAEDTDEIPVKKYVVLEDLDTKLNEYERKERNRN